MKPSIFALLLLIVSNVSFAYKSITDDKLQELLQSFRYRPEVNISVKPKVSCDSQVLKYTTTYPQRETPLEIEARAYIPARDSTLPAAPVVFILPPLGGTSPLDANMAETFCKNRIAAVIIVTDLTGLSNPTLVPVTDHDQTGRRVASAIKGGMLVMQDYAEVDSDKVGVFGASLGGILSSIAYSVIPEISAATFIVNGGDVPYILAHSDQPKVIELKNARKKEQGLRTDDEYEAYLNEHMEIDPLHFAKLIPSDSVKQYLSKNDASVASSKQLEYHNAIGKPSEVKFYDVGHAPTIIAVMSLGKLRREIADWFNQRFTLPNPRRQ